MERGTTARELVPGLMKWCSGAKEKCDRNENTLVRSRGVVGGRIDAHGRMANWAEQRRIRSEDSFAGGALRCAGAKNL